MKLDPKVVDVLCKSGRDDHKLVQEVVWAYLCNHRRSVKTITPLLNLETSELYHPSLLPEDEAEVNMILRAVFNCSSEESQCPR